MNKYGEAAVLSARILGELREKDPEDIWNKVTSRIFGKGTWSQKKGCPRDAFLGLCGAGLVKGVPPGNYTQSQLNKQYDLMAVKILRAS